MSDTSSPDPTSAAPTGTDGATDSSSSCGTGSPYNGSLGLRVGALFIILATSTFGALMLRVPPAVYDFAKYFGAGVIIATAFIHLLSSGEASLNSPCLADGTWGLYDFAAAIAMASVFMIFFIEFFAFRFGMAMLQSAGIELDAGQLHGAAGQNHEHHTAHEHRPDMLAPKASTPLAEKADPEKADTASLASSTSQSAALAQLLGVAILEFGVIFHSVVIGLTLAVTGDFITLFIVIIFHQMFEGLGLGSRLAFLPLPSRLNWVPIIGAITYALMTPIGMAIGLGVRETYDPDSATALIVQGCLDSFSAGILLYTGLVELLAHEFIFQQTWKKAPMSKVLYAFTCLILGTGIMALLGRWA